MFAENCKIAFVPLFFYVRFHELMPHFLPASLHFVPRCAFSSLRKKSLNFTEAVWCEQYVVGKHTVNKMSGFEPALATQIASYNEPAMKY
jgi:hypothetical protein